LWVAPLSMDGVRFIISLLRMIVMLGGKVDHVQLFKFLNLWYHYYIWADYSTKFFHVSMIFIFFLNWAGFSSLLPRNFVAIAMNRFFKLGGIFVAIATKVRRYCHESSSLLPQKFCLSQKFIARETISGYNHSRLRQSDLNITNKHLSI
jgi:hypothetical protein